jgi:hypothetical protein
VQVVEIEAGLADEIIGQHEAVIACPAGVGSSGGKKPMVTNVGLPGFVLAVGSFTAGAFHFDILPHPIRHSHTGFCPVCGNRLWYD